MKNIISLILLTFFTVTFSQEKTQEINWAHIDQADSLRAAQPDKEILISFYTDWCGWCKRMEKTTFKDQEIVKTINEKYIPVRFNAEQEEDVVFNGKKYKFIEAGRKGVHSFAYFTLQGKMSYPSVAILDTENKVIKIIKGYQKANSFKDEI